MAEFRYRPLACKREYRIIVVRKDLEIRCGQQAQFENQQRHFVYITNDGESPPPAVVEKANGRCNQENLIAQHKHGVPALKAPVGSLESNGAYMVMASPDWSRKAWAALLLPEEGRCQEQKRRLTPDPSSQDDAFLRRRRTLRSNSPFSRKEKGHVTAGKSRQNGCEVASEGGNWYIHARMERNCQSYSYSYWGAHMTGSTHLSMLLALHEASPDDTVWLSFQKQYSSLLRTWVLRQGVSEHDADDLTQVILLRLSQQLPKFHFDPAQGRFRSWLATIVRNAVIDFQRAQGCRKDRPVGGTTALHALQSEAIVDEVADCLETQFHSDLQDAVDAVRVRVNPRQWQAFWMSTVEERSAAEIALQLGLTRAAVYQANWKVKKLLADHYRSSLPGRP